MYEKCPFSHPSCPFILSSEFNHQNQNVCFLLTSVYIVLENVIQTLKIVYLMDKMRTLRAAHALENKISKINNLTLKLLFETNLLTPLTLKFPKRKLC